MTTPNISKRNELVRLKTVFHNAATSQRESYITGKRIVGILALASLCDELEKLIDVLNTE